MKRSREKDLTHRVTVVSGAPAGARHPMAALSGAVLNADAGAGVVYAHMPGRRKAGIELAKGVLIGRTGESLQ